MNVEMTGKIVFLLITSAYLIYKICKLPKPVRNTVLIILALSYTAAIFLAIYFPEPLTAFMAKFQ